MHRSTDKFINATGASGSDGTPDDYFYVTNPAQLVSSLQRAFSQIVAKVASGTAAAVVASAGQGSGAVYQAFYEPVHQETITPNRQARWIGTLQALFIGPDGRLYEDTNQDGKLTVGTDNAIVFTYDTVSNVTKFQVDDGSVPLTTPLQDLSTLKPIWNARKTLATPASGVVVPQRGYSASDTTKRYIFTWIDENLNGKVTPSEIYDFTTAAIPSTDYWFFNLINGAGAPTAATTEAQNIINWVRGEDLTGYRNRTLAYNASDGPGGAATQRLGDIIDSTPSVVATPSQAFDLLYGDQSYGVYRNNNACRRQVVLVGANDGMLHAFNAGFYNVANQAFATSPNTTGCATGSSSSTNTYALGEEIWAYVPQNLIPQLTWLTKDPPATNGYTHVYYVDGTPRIFDVNLPSVINHTCSGTVNSTTVDCSHWGTIAVVPFRLGGGLINVDTKGDGSAMRNYHSGYIIMDVTDPEQPPKLLGEITLPGNELATSSPTVVPIRKADAGSSDPNSWFLVVGSGPDTRTSVSSTVNAQVFAYDLNALKGTNAQGVTKTEKTFDTGMSTAFAGDLVASDWNLDFQSEGVYFGTEQTTSGADFNGEFFKLQTHSAGTGAPDTTLGAWAVDTMYDASNLNNKPVSIRPTLGVDDNATPYAFFGTGRLFASADLGTTQQQSIFGLKDKSETLNHPTGCSGDAKCVLDSASKLLSGCVVQSNGQTTGACGSEAAGTSFTQLTADATNNCLGTTPPSPCYDGWQLNLSTPAAGDTHSGSERVVSSQTLFGGELFTSSYIPNTSLCGAIGLSNLYAQDYRTGTANPSNSPFGTTTTSGTTTVNLSTQVGAGGLASPPSLIVHPGAGGNGSATLQSCVQTSTGQIVCQNLGSNIGPNNGEVSWRQLLNNN
jgi:type IV pilus assembly protein PilY1